MKRIRFFLTLVAISAVGCSTRPTYKREYAPVEAKEYKYVDKNIEFTYVPTTYAATVPVTFANKTDKPMKIIWDETTFIYPSGQSERVTHEGVRFMEKGAPQVPSIISPKSKLADTIIPVSRVNIEGLQWRYRVICNDPEEDSYSMNGMLHMDASCVGKIFGMFITYEIDGKKSSFTVKYTLANRIVDQPGTGKYK